MLLLSSTVLLSCDSKKDDAAPAPSAGSKPPIEVVARTVALQKTISRRAPSGGGEDESWDALDGQVYALVTTDIAHNACSEGDKIDIRKASLLLADGKPAAAVGGGLEPDEVCVLCQPSAPVSCSGGQSPLERFIFVFSVPQDADVKKIQLRYQDRDAALADAEIVDKRGNEEIDVKIAAKQEEIDKLRKELENTGNKSRGELILGQIEELQREIDVLKKKKL
jgi:hypothetical protein